MSWTILVIAGLCEVVFATCLTKYKDTFGFEAGAWLLGFWVFSSLSMYLLYKATQTIPMGTAYAVWTGIGAVGSVIVGMVVFKEPSEFWRLFFLITLISSIIGLKFVSSNG